MQNLINTDVSYHFNQQCCNRRDSRFIDTLLLLSLIDRVTTQNPLFLLPFLIGLLIGCQNISADEEKRFTLLPADSTQIHFRNSIEDTPEFNILNYLYFYDGAGVAAGDINNDGLVDLYFTANDTTDGLYLNLGNFQFRDITKSAGIFTDDNGWSTGVTMADVNGDGHLDIYVSRVNYLSKAGANQLFINQGDTQFVEQAAEYGLDLKGYATQAAFFDYDRDGDLDLFQLNHTMHGANSYGEAKKLRAMDHPKAGDRLFENINGNFIDVSDQSGIYSSHLGYGLGIVVSDINMDGWPDIYVGNDFHEDDYLYINQQNGRFKEQLSSSISHTTRSTMGVDIADLNNDGLVEVFALDMLPEDLKILKQSGGADLRMISETKANYGFKPQFAHNALQLNRGLDSNGMPLFSEIGFSAGVAATDWSWSALIMDLDNNGYNDLYATNGIYRRPNDLDFVRQFQNFQKDQIEGKVSPKRLGLIDHMPHVKRSNFLFKNTGSFPLHNVAADWGLATPSYSNGAVYSDLNNDGYLDLAVNNINQPAFIYRNNGSDGNMENYLLVQLQGNTPNTTGIGAKVWAYRDSTRIYREQQPVRGFQSSVPHRLHIGLGSIQRLDSLNVIWPDGTVQTIMDVESNRIITVKQADAVNTSSTNENSLGPQESTTLFEDISHQLSIDSLKTPVEILDMDDNPLMPYSKSTAKRALASADVNGDGLDDFYLGGLKWAPGILFLQQPSGRFTRSDQPVFALDRKSVDADAVFFDANGDSHPDLYVVSGGNIPQVSDAALEDRLYLNDGNGNFRRPGNALPTMLISGGTVAAADMDGDGDTDLFVGGSNVPMRYGIKPRSYLLENDGDGFFTNLTSDLAPGLERIGMINDAKWVHMNSERDQPELLLAGEWMPLTVFEFDGTKWINNTSKYHLEETGGLWQSLETGDFNNDGLQDFAAGNFGTNSRMNATPNTPLRLYVDDFLNSSQSIPVVATRYNGNWTPFEPMDELAQQLPDIHNQFKSYKNFSASSLSDIFDNEDLQSALKGKVVMLESALFIQTKDGTFTARKLPFLAQITPLMAMKSGDFTTDGALDLLIGGNLMKVKPSYGGSQDAGKGLFLRGDNRGNFKALSSTNSGYFTTGMVRGIQQLGDNEEELRVVIARYKDTPLLFNISLQPK